MADFTTLAAILVLAIVAVGLVRILYGPTAADRLMAVQLLGTGGIAALLLMARVVPMAGIIDVALVLALLAAFISVAFVKAAEARPGEER
jgi:multicomponent Na+:H+ antiporter subunit F